MLRRLFQLYRILRKHDVLYLLQAAEPPARIRWLLKQRTPERDHSLSPGKRLAAALQEMGPTFIKLGQVLATRADLIGEEIAIELAELQDRLPPFSSTTAKQLLEEELGDTVANLFKDFNPDPVAAASIAQVHRAVTADGRDVAVKIMRPDVEAAFAKDTALFKRLVSLVDKHQPAYKRLRLSEMMQVFEDTVAAETDLRMEAAAAEELRENMGNHPDLYIPAIDWDRTAKRVLTLEWIEGIKLSNVAALDKVGADRTEILRKLANIFFLQVLRDGYFHADMHPGNVFILADNRIAVIDFGIMGRLEKRMRYFLADTFHGFLIGDYKRVSEVHFREGIVPQNQSVELFTQACRAIGAPLTNKPLSDVSLGRLLAQLFAVSEQFQMVLQPQLLLLQKSMVVTEGVGRLLNPEINMWELSRGLIESWMRQNRSPQAQFKEKVMEGLEALSRLPEVLKKLEILIDEETKATSR